MASSLDCFASSFPSEAEASSPAIASCAVLAEFEAGNSDEPFLGQDVDPEAIWEAEPIVPVPVSSAIPESLASKILMDRDPPRLDFCLLQKRYTALLDSCFRFQELYSIPVLRCCQKIYNSFSDSTSMR
jgi:hypothetical protein